jgi:glycosyltransferase involved in cell wall biosynthesis
VVTRHEHRVRLFALPGYAALDRRIGRGASVVLAVSQAVLETDAARQPSLRAKSRVVHHGLDPTPIIAAGETARRRIREEWGIPVDTVLIGSVARLSPEKSLETLLEGFAQLLERNGGVPKLAMALVGPGPSEAELRALAGSLDIADEVIFAGRREDIPSVLNAFDIFVLPSVYEGFGLAVLEAMAAGLPVIASRIGAFEEIVAESETGRLFELRNPHALADELEALVCNPELRRTFGANGRHRVEQDFSLEAMHAKTWNAYLDALAG